MLVHLAVILVANQLDLRMLRKSRNVFHATIITSSPYKKTVENSEWRKKRPSSVNWTKEASDVIDMMDMFVVFRLILLAYRPIWAHFLFVSGEHSSEG
jgi:hypothetical protein